VICRFRSLNPALIVILKDLFAQHSNPSVILNIKLEFFIIKKLDKNHLTNEFSLLHWHPQVNKSDTESDRIRPADKILWESGLWAH
jgi:hypothetical protein